jgi:hypothetical protein
VDRGSLANFFLYVKAQVVVAAACWVGPSTLAQGQLFRQELHQIRANSIEIVKKLPELMKNGIYMCIGEETSHLLHENFASSNL